MPRVPTWNQQVDRGTLPSAGFSANANATAMGGGFAAGTGAVADDFARAAQEEKQKADAVAVLGAQAQHGQALNAIEEQIRNTRGGDALKRGEDGGLVLQQKALEQYGSQADKIAAGLSNDTQRAAFRADVVRSRVSLDGTIRDHVLRESDTYEAQAFGALMETSRNSAIAADGDPFRIGTEIGNQQRAIDEFAQRRGLPPEWVAEHTADAASKTHVAVIDRMLANGSDQGALEYYRQHNDEVVGGDKIGVEKALEISTNRGESQKQSDEIVAAAKDEGAALAAARKITDPKLRDETTNRVQAYYAENRSALAGSQQDAFNVGLQALNDPQNTKGMDGVPANVLAAMGPHREALESYAARRAKGEDPVTDRVLFYKLQIAASDAATRDDFAKEFLPAYVDRLSTADFHELTKLQASVREKANDKEAQSRLTWGVTTREGLMADTFRQLGIKTGDTASVDDATKAIALRGKVDQAMVALQAREKRPATEEEVRKIVGHLVTQVSYGKPGWLYGTNKVTALAFTAPYAGKLAFETTDVPADAIDEIRQEMTAQGKRLSDDQIVDIYNQQLIREKNAR